MTINKRGQIYRCNICGNIVELLHAGAGQLVCCGQLMELMQEKTKGEGSEKHVPIVGKFFDSDPEGTKNAVIVGKILHPMEEKHYIEWIEIINNGTSIRKFLRPGDLPKILFDFTNIDPSKIKFRGYCNIHGLWSTE